MFRPHFQVVLMYKSGDAANEQALEAVIYAEMAVQEAVDLGGMVRARTRVRVGVVAGFDAVRCLSASGGVLTGLLNVLPGWRRQDPVQEVRRV